ncbi:diphosphomevalonate decarboxylase [Myroides sp. LJL116]
MTIDEFIFNKPVDYTQNRKGKFSWNSPSNIALVKYWGKKEDQIPANPSLSFTLNNCKTTTELAYTSKEEKAISFELFFHGELKPSFNEKVGKFFERIVKYCPYIEYFNFSIHTENTFPHSSGIASSASAMAALAVNIMSLEKVLNPAMEQDYFNKKASFLARLGSGSACRSIHGEVVVWGQQKDIEGSSDLYGVEFPYEIHPVFKNYCDVVLLVDKGQKQVSSTVGHELMHEHPFAQRRFEQAHENLSKLKDILIQGDLPAFMALVESEALTLHAMMMTSMPYFILFKPNTLEIIEKIWAFREQTGVPVCFTLDAGANVHLLFPEQTEQQVMKCVEEQLAPFCEKGQFIADKMGLGSTENK